MNTPYHPYTIAYDNPLLRGEEEKRPWDFLEIVKKNAAPNKSLLDIGCGTAIKLVQIAPYFGEVIGIEPNPHMLDQAKKTIQQHQFSHICLIEGFAHKLPVENAIIDVVTAMMSAQEAIEIYRVLKPGGMVLIEAPGEQDKKDLKDFFIEKKGEPRGQFSHLPKGVIKKLYFDTFKCLFHEVVVQEGFWDAYLTWEGLIALLSQTPTIKNFELNRDIEQLKKAAQHLNTEKGIKVTHHRVLIMAKK